MEIIEKHMQFHIMLSFQNCNYKLCNFFNHIHEAITILSLIGNQLFGILDFPESI